MGACECEGVQVFKFRVGKGYAFVEGIGSGSHRFKFGNPGERRTRDKGDLEKCLIGFCVGLCLWVCEVVVVGFGVVGHIPEKDPKTHRPQPENINPQPETPNHKNIEKT